MITSTKSIVKIAATALKKAAPKKAATATPKKIADPRKPVLSGMTLTRFTIERAVRFHLTMDTLTIRQIVPLVGSIEDFHLQVIRTPPRGWEQRQSMTLRAMPGAPLKSHLSKVACDNSITK